MIHFVPVTSEKQRPMTDEWYLVRCDGFCESGFAIAKWDYTAGKWIDEDNSDNIHQFILEYSPRPVSLL